MKELGSSIQKNLDKISRLRVDLSVELELRRDGFLKRNLEFEKEFKPVHPFMSKLRTEVLIGVLIGTTLAGSTLWLLNRLVSRQKN